MEKRTVSKESIDAYDELTGVTEQMKKARALNLLMLHRFPQGPAGTIIKRAGRIYVVNEKGEQMRVK
jgi:hypothetical protein